MLWRLRDCFGLFDKRKILFELDIGIEFLLNKVGISEFEKII